ncbi:MAG: ankyrin repeat domain-containing protein [archaeon]|nr:ankyrin repeat domain-containing protein [archaeon]
MNTHTCITCTDNEIRKYSSMKETSEKNELKNKTFGKNDLNILLNNKYEKEKNKSKLKRNYTKDIVMDSNAYIDKIIVKRNIRNYNINITYTPEATRFSPKRSYSHQKFNTLWRKSMNLVRMSNAFLHPKLEKIQDEEIFNDSMKLSLLGIKKPEKKRRMTYNSTPNVIVKKEGLTYEQFLRKSPVEREFIKVSLKEKAAKLIEDGSLGNGNIFESFDYLFNQNPERTKYYPENKKFLFNQPLPNGKTLLYIACQEGTYEIVKYLLRKGLDPNIKSQYCGMEDTCLGVACRWGYCSIVEALLETGKIDQYSILYVYEKEKDLSLNIKEILLKYLPEKKPGKGCACF